MSMWTKLAVVVALGVGASVPIYHEGIWAWIERWSRDRWTLTRIRAQQAREALQRHGFL